MSHIAFHEMVQMFGKHRARDFLKAIEAEVVNPSNVVPICPEKRLRAAFSKLTLHLNESPSSFAYSS